MPIEPIPHRTTFCDQVTYKLNGTLSWIRDHSLPIIAGLVAHGAIRYFRLRALESRIEDLSQEVTSLSAQHETIKATLSQLRSVCKIG